MVPEFEAPWANFNGRQDANVHGKTQHGSSWPLDLALYLLREDAIGSVPRQMQARPSERAVGS